MYVFNVFDKRWQPGETVNSKHNASVQKYGLHTLTRIVRVHIYARNQAVNTCNIATIIQYIGHTPVTLPHTFHSHTLMPHQWYGCVGINETNHLVVMECYPYYTSHSNVLSPLVNTT